MNEKGINQWNNNGYLHNFVIDLTEKGAGREIIKAVEALAVNDHKDGGYEGNRREKYMALL